MKILNMIKKLIFKILKTRILVTLIYEMLRQNKAKGCATLCIGGGMGIAICVEKI